MENGPKLYTESPKPNLQLFGIKNSSYLPKIKNICVTLHIAT